MQELPPPGTKGLPLKDHEHNIGPEGMSYLLQRLSDAQGKAMEEAVQVCSEGYSYASMMSRYTDPEPFQYPFLGKRAYFQLFHNQYIYLK